MSTCLLAVVELILNWLYAEEAERILSLEESSHVSQGPLSASSPPLKTLLPFEIGRI
jgi:hypothetical protein